MRKRNLLVLLDQGLNLPSAMVAGLQYKELFDTQSNYAATFLSYNEPPSPTVNKLYALGRKIGLSRFVSRFERFRSERHRKRVVEITSKMDVVFVVKVPSLEFYRKIRAASKPRILTCFADAAWLPAFKPWWDDLHQILSLSDGIVCENDFMVEYAGEYCPKVSIMHDSPQLDVFDRYRHEVQKDSDIITIGWIGNPATACYLYKILESLETIFSRNSNIHLRLVGAHSGVVPRFENVKWSAVSSYTQEDMVKEVLKMDIGLFPMFENQEAMARGILKATVYMSGGTVAICQNYGDITNWIKDGHNGMLAETGSDWINKIEWLIHHKAEREKIADNGLNTIRENLTKEHCFNELISALDGVLAS